MTPRELAAAIRKGHTMIGEKVDFMPLPSQEKAGCALCAAWFGAGYTEHDYWGKYPPSTPATEKFADKLQIPVKLANEINDRHCQTFNRLAIADWLDTLEPETKAADKQTFDAFMKTVLAPRPELQSLQMGASHE